MGATASSITSALTGDWNQSVAKMSNSFGLKIYRSVCSEEPNNLVFSPLSITSALTMTYMGARDTTAKQMEEVMDLKPLGENLHQNIKDHNAALVSEGDTYTLKMASRLYGQKSFTFNSDFVDATKEFYQAKLEALDFRNDPENARQAVNEWIEEQTERKIKNLLSAGSISPDTRLVLVNAVYFKCEWFHPFPKRGTSGQPFHISPAEEINVSMMYQKSMFGYYDDWWLNCKVLLMKFVGHDKMEMMVVLPDKIGDLDTLESHCSATTIQKWRRKSQREVKVHVSLPKFKITKDFSLAVKLNELGMRDAFSERYADLTGINKDGDLYLSDVIHKAFIDVNEDGCEAAAATASVILYACSLKLDEPEPKVFKADHPFLYFVQSTESGAIVFMGRVQRPHEM